MVTDGADTWKEWIEGRVVAALRTNEFVGVIVRTNEGDLDELDQLLKATGARNIRQLGIIDAVAAEAPEQAIRSAVTHETVTKVIFDGVATISDRENK